MSTSIIIFIAVIAVMAVVGYLMKSFIKVVVVLGLAYLLFHVGFLWKTEDLSKLHLNTFLKQETNQQVQDKYSEFTKKREEKGVVNNPPLKR